MKTVVCIDGFNLYFSALTKTSYKWLDLYALMERVLESSARSPPPTIENVLYFTAPVKAKYCSDPDSEKRQKAYHQALLWGAKGPVEIFQGSHEVEYKKARVIEGGKPRNKLDRVEVLEEKITDVNLGLKLYSSALRPDIDQVVLVSNDRDLLPAFEQIKKDCPQVTRGLVIPARDKGSGSRMAGKLKELSNWARTHITEDELKASQMPRSVINGRGKPIIRPNSWSGDSN